MDVYGLTVNPAAAYKMNFAFESIARTASAKGNASGIAFHGKRQHTEAAAAAAGKSRHKGKR